MKYKIVEQTIYLNRGLAKRMEEVISTNPSLNFSVIINSALEEWFRHQPPTNLNRDCFITDASKGFGPTYVDALDCISMPVIRKSEK